MSEITFRGVKGDSFCIESAIEFNNIVYNRSEFADPVQALKDWCMYYEGELYLPINYALQAWKIAGDDVWDIVEGEFRRYLYYLHEHKTDIITKADLRKIRRKLRKKTNKIKR